MERFMGFFKKIVKTLTLIIATSAVNCAAGTVTYNFSGTLYSGLEGTSFSDGVSYSISAEVDLDATPIYSGSYYSAYVPNNVSLNIPSLSFDALAKGPLSYVNLVNNFSNSYYQDYITINADFCMTRNSGVCSESMALINGVGLDSFQAGIYDKGNDLLNSAKLPTSDISLDLADNTAFQVWSISGNAAGGYIDNAQVLTTSHTPTHYGLFIGALDPGSSLQNVAYFDTMASDLANAFGSRPNSNAYTLIGDLTPLVNGGYSKPITLSDIQSYLDGLKMGPGDTLTLYIGGHGGSVGDEWYNNFIGGGQGDEAIWVGSLIFDNWLADALLPFNDYSKLIFLDSCHSGGFWGSNDMTEIRGPVDLDALQNIALFAAAHESGLAYMDGNGIGLFSLALREAFLQKKSWTIEGLGEYIHDTAKDFADWYEFQFPDSHLYSLDLGDPIPVNEVNPTVFWRASSDLSPATEIYSVPEPASMALIGIGLSGLVLSRRRKRFSALGEIEIKGARFTLFD